MLAQQEGIQGEENANLRNPNENGIQLPVI